jgi:hypothetical protein
MPSCFVIMGFGEKTDLATGRKLNLDKTYKNIIKPAVEAAGYKCVRADEVQHAGVIDIPMYEMLYDADLVIADLSTANLNAMFELGVRHGLKPRTTVIIAEDQFKSPFDVNHIVIRKYQHLGPDIGFDEAKRMTEELTALLKELAKGDRADSPVYAFVSGLQKPERKAAASGAAPAPVAAAATAGEKDPDSYGAWLEAAQEAKNNGEWAGAKTILRKIYNEQTKPKPDGTRNQARTRVVQELALATYKAAEKEGGEAQLKGYAEAIDLLKALDPLVTTDPETLGQWSAIHKRRADLPGRSPEEKLADLNIAIAAAERGFFIRQDFYTGGNLAFLLDLRASMTTGEEQIADRVLARRYRRRLVDITQAELARIPAQSTSESDTLNETRYWVKAAHAEALIGLGDPKGESSLEEAFKIASAGWMKDTTTKQIGKLKELHKAG